MELKRTLDGIAESSKRSFEDGRAVLSFEEYLELLSARPYTLSRNASQYMRDLYDLHGSYEAPGMGGRPQRRWRVYDDPAGGGMTAVFGHEEVQDRIYSILSEFVRRGHADKFILLHGPNGSAKSSVVNCLISGLEHYSQMEEGQLFRFSWIFCEAGDRKSMGFSQTAPLEEMSSFAHVDERMISSRIPCEMKDPPFFLLPPEERRRFFEEALDTAGDDQKDRFALTDFVSMGELSGKNRVIYDCLLKAYEGDWRKVMRHVRVERYTLSQRYRTGLVTIESQVTIDAGARLLLGHSTAQGLPPVLAYENLVEATGDLVEANGGLVEYSEFLKRNPEANKYLLTTAERGFVNLPAVTVALNLVLFGSTNAKYLTAFKRDPSFPSFKGRFELVRVPYLRDYTQEARIYERHLEQVSPHLPVAPHTATLAAMWATLTRLRKPDSKHFTADAKEVMARIEPLEKARLYGEGRIPQWCGDKEAKLIRQSIDDLTTEYDPFEEEFEGNVEAAYEGRHGASPREVMTLITEIAVDEQTRCLSPVSLFDTLPRLTAEKSLYSFLRIAKQGAYHDPEGFIDVIKTEYARMISKEIQSASDLVDEAEYRRLFQDYMTHVRASETREKVSNPQTGAPQDPDAELLASVESRLEVDEDKVAEFRQGLMTKAAAWRLSNKEKPLVLEELFRDLFRALERSFFRERRERILSIVEDVLLIEKDAADDLSPERRQAAQHLVERLMSDFGYEQETLRVMLSWFQKHNDLLEI